MGWVELLQAASPVHLFVFQMMTSCLADHSLLYNGVCDSVAQ